MQWSQDPNQSKVDNRNNARPEASRHLRKQKKKQYLKAEIVELETNSKIKISEGCIAASMTLRRVTSLELIA